MATRVVQTELWETVTALAREAKRSFVAVAYLGSDSASLLPLKRGNIVVVDMSPPAVQAGCMSSDQMRH